jgi:hypothetical protein
MRRAKHPVKELEAVIREAEKRGWRAEKRTYYMLWCPCPEKHKKTVHLTPSGSRYERNLRAWLRRLPCWEEEQ